MTGRLRLPFWLRTFDTIDIMFRDLWLIPINFVLLPLILFLIAVILISTLDALERRLPPHSRLKNWLRKPNRWKNPHWLRDRIDMFFVVFIVIVLVVVTVTYF